MVFASYSFLFIFLPIALAGYYVATKVGANFAVAWLTLCSLAFYACWNPKFVILLLASITFNFTVGRALLARKTEEDSPIRNRLLFCRHGRKSSALGLLQVPRANALIRALHFVNLSEIRPQSHSSFGHLVLSPSRR